MRNGKLLKYAKLCAFALAFTIVYPSYSDSISNFTSEPGFCSSKGSLASVKTLQAHYRSLDELSTCKSNKTRYLILDLVDYSWVDLFRKILENLKSQSRNINTLYCDFPVPEWGMAICKTNQYSMFCDQENRLPCQSFRDEIKLPKEVEKIWSKPQEKYCANSPYRLFITHDIRYIKKADVIYFEGLLFRVLSELSLDWKEFLNPSIKRNQFWTLQAIDESPANWNPTFEDESFLSSFDYTWGNDERFMGTWIPLSWFPINEPAGYWLDNKYNGRRRGSIMFLSSHCDNIGAWRTEYVRELMQYVPIDSYGKCLNNIKPEIDLSNGTLSSPGELQWDQIKHNLMKQYDFTISIENSECYDYVSEKFFGPLVAGSIPVYIGAPNILTYSPGKNSFINGRDFKTAKALGLFLKTILKDEAGISSYLDWKGDANAFLLSPMWKRVKRARMVPSDLRCESVKRASKKCER